MADCDKCPHSATIAALKERDGEFVETLRRFESKLDRIGDSVAKIMVLENEHGAHKEALARAFLEIDGLKKKVDGLMDDLKERSGAAKLFKFVWPIIWAIGGAVAALALMQMKYILYLVGHAQ